MHRIARPGKKGENLPAQWLMAQMLKHKSDGYYLIHNHPSGDPEPSSPDVEVTKNLQKNVSGYKGHIMPVSGPSLMILPLNKDGGVQMTGELQKS